MKRVFDRRIRGAHLVEGAPSPRGLKIEVFRRFSSLARRARD